MVAVRVAVRVAEAWAVEVLEATAIWAVAAMGAVATVAVEMGCVGMVAAVMGRRRAPARPRAVPPLR